MAKKTFNKRFISIFVDRFIPDFFKEQYPNYRQFIFHFLEYLEQDNNAWENIYNYIKFIDIDKINEEEDADKRNLLLNEIYKQFLGSEEARYLSDLMDEILFIKNQKSILRQKGTKSSFLFFLTLAINGYFNIENITYNNKIHNGLFQHNGEFTYENNETFLEPYIYLLTSEFVPSQYQEVIKVLNPAGVKPIYYHEKQIETTSNYGDIISDIKNLDNVYMIYYLSSTGSAPNIGMVKISNVDAVDLLSIDATTYDYKFQNGNLYEIIDVDSTGANKLLYRAYVNNSMFNGVYDSVKIVINPIVTGNTVATEYYYEGTDIVSEGELLYDVFVDGGEEYEIIERTTTQLLVTFTTQTYAYQTINYSGDSVTAENLKEYYVDDTIVNGEPSVSLTHIILPSNPSLNTRFKFTNSYNESGRSWIVTQNTYDQITMFDNENFTTTLGEDGRLYGTQDSISIELVCVKNNEDKKLWKIVNAEQYFEYQISFKNNYWGTGEDGDLTIDGTTEYIENELDGDMVVKNYNNLTLINGAGLTVRNRCKGLFIYCKGDLTLEGASIISMTGKGASNLDPIEEGVHENGLQLFRYSNNYVGGATKSIMDGFGAAIINSENNQIAVPGIFQTIYRIKRISGATIAIGGNPGENGENGGYDEEGMSCGSGGGGSGASLTYSGGNGGLGNCFGGGAGGGGGGDNGNGGNALYGIGGAGGIDNGIQGSGAIGSENNMVGGVLIILVKGNVTINSSDLHAYGLSSTIYKQGTIGNCGGVGGGGIFLLYGGNLIQDTFTIIVDGGVGSFGDTDNGSFGSTGISVVEKILL